MSRKWRIGDRVLRPVFGPREVARCGQRWERCVVETVRKGGLVVVRAHGHLYEHHEDELREIVHRRRGLG